MSSRASDLFRMHALETADGDSAWVSGLGGGVSMLTLSCASGEQPECVLRNGSLEGAKDLPFDGKLLFPWNDRIPGGRWTFDGQAGQLASNCPEDGAAIHGFFYRKLLDCVASGCDDTGAFLVLAGQTEAEDEPGWPFPLALQVTYRLEPGVFRMACRVENLGRERAPFALGWHPYFRLGGALEDWILTHGGRAYVPVGPDLLPLGGMAPVEGTAFDFRRGTRLGDLELDVALQAPSDGGWGLEAPEGIRLAFQADPDLFAFTQFYIPPDRRAIALEPVTSPTDALNRPHLGLRVLEPGAVVCGNVTVQRLR